MNTRIDYLYRDACNYKTWNSVVICGLLSDRQKQEILNCLACGDYFIPSDVGLPEVRFDEFNSEVDTDWFEMYGDAFEETKNKYDINITPEELVAAFQACKNKWNAMWNY